MSNRFVSGLFVSLHPTVAIWNQKRSVVIGQWEVLWNKQPVQKGARGHVEFPKF